MIKKMAKNMEKMNKSQYNRISDTQKKRPMHKPINTGRPRPKREKNAYLLLLHTINDLSMWIQFHVYFLFK